MHQRFWFELKFLFSFIFGCDCNFFPINTQFFSLNQSINTRSPIHKTHYLLDAHSVNLNDQRIEISFANVIVKVIAKFEVKKFQFFHPFIEEKPLENNMGIFGSSEVKTETKDIDTNGHVNTNIIFKEEAKDVHSHLLIGEKLLFASYLMVGFELIKLFIFVCQAVKKTMKKKYGAASKP